MFTNKQNKTEYSRATKLVVGKKTFANSKAGFTLFVALIVSSLLLSIGLSLSNIILKQLLFSGSGRESQIAFYAADSGAECALYWDVKDEIGLTTFEGPFSKNTEVDEENVNIRCGFTGEPGVYGKVGSFEKYTIPEVGPDDQPATTTSIFHLDLTPDTGEQTDPSCAIVTVIKAYTPDPDHTDIDSPAPMLERTRVESRGYNSSYVNDLCDLNNPRIVERAVVLTY